MTVLNDGIIFILFSKIGQYQPQGGEEARDRPFSIEGDYVPHVKEGSSSWKWQWQSCCSSWKSSSWKPSYNPDWSGIWIDASPMISPMMSSAGLFFPLTPPPLPSELPLYLAPLNHNFTMSCCPLSLLLPQENIHFKETSCTALLTSCIDLINFHKKEI